MPEDPATGPEPSLAEDLAAHSEPAAEPSPEPSPEPAEPGPDLGTEPGTEPAPAGTEPSPEPGDPAAILNFYAEHYSPGVKDKFKDDLDFLEGVRNLEALLGQRNEDAVAGKQFRGHERQFQDYLAAQQGRAPQQPVAPSQPAHVPSFEEFQLLQSQVVRDPDSGLPVAAQGAPLDAPQRLQSASEAMQRTIHALTYQPEQVLAPMFQAQGQALQQQAQTIVEQQTQAANDQSNVAKFEAENAKWMYRDGQNGASGLTPQGQKFQNYCQQGAGSGLRSMTDVMNYAVMGMRAEAAPAQNTLTPNPAAQRRPDVAQRPPETPSEDDLVAGETLYQSLMRQAQAGT